MKVLIAEDDPITSHLLQALVLKAGYELAIAGDGSEVLQALAQPDGPRLVILDWMMPEMDGLEVCRAVRQNTSGHYVYLIFLSAKGKSEEIVQGLEAGADDYIIKPFDFHELKARLRAGRRILDLQDQLIAQAKQDSLTGLLNHEAILDALQKESIRADREKTHLAVIMADIDEFKRINDSHGHAAGDVVLREAVRRMRAVLRPYDSVGRYGGEEFLIAAPGCDISEAAELAERLRNSVSELPIATPGCTLSVTMSFGVAEKSAGQNSEEVLRASDIALYAAKKAGRNRVETCSPLNAASS